MKRGQLGGTVGFPVGRREGRSGCLGNIVNSVGGQSSGDPEPVGAGTATVLAALRIGGVLPWDRSRRRPETKKLGKYQKSFLGSRFWEWRSQSVCGGNDDGFWLSVGAGCAAANEEAFLRPQNVVVGTP